MKQYIQRSGRIQCSYVPCANISRVFAAKQLLPFVFSVFAFVARISLVHDLNILAPIPAGRDSPCRCREAPLTSLSAILFVSIMLRFFGPMPGGDHSTPGRVRKPVGPLGPLSPSGVLPIPASCVGQPFGVPGEPSTSRSAQGGPSAEAFTTDGIASQGYPLLGCSPSHQYEVQVGLWEGLCNNNLLETYKVWNIGIGVSFLKILKPSDGNPSRKPLDFWCCCLDLEPDVGSQCRESV